MHPRGGYFNYLILVLGLLVGLLTVLQVAEDRPVEADRSPALEGPAEARVDEVNVSAAEQAPSAPQRDVLRAVPNPQQQRADIPRHLSFADTRPLRIQVQLPKPKIAAPRALWQSLPPPSVSRVSSGPEPTVSAASASLRTVVLLI